MRKDNMRTVIFMGLLYIGDAIRETVSSTYSRGVIALFATVLLVSMIMDIGDFLKRK